MRVFLGVVAVLVILALLFGGMYVSRRNQMVTLNEAVKFHLGRVDVCLQRRSALIPNLVETVKGFAAHEETVYNDIAQARAALGGAQTPKDRLAANGQLDGARSRLLLIVENYPQLKSNENFLRLQDELAGTENRIAVERKRYDDSIQAYNTYIGLFPNNIYAGWAGFKRNDAYFQASETSREAPKVQFPAAKP